MMNVRRYVWTSACLAVLVGCGGGNDSSVTGSVTLDGTPLTKGMVTFHPTGGGALAVGTIDSSGKFRLKTGSSTGLPPGEYLVTVVATEMPEGAAASAEEPMPVKITPEKYADKDKSGLKFTVKGGENDFPIELKR